MKKAIISCVLLLILIMLAAAAQAVAIVCVQENALGTDFAYNIMQATLDNGQVIYYISTTEDGWAEMADVNFDGYDDFVPVVVKGARNLCSVFYLYDPQTGQYEPLHTVDRGFWNYSLDEEKQYVISHEQDGYRDGEKKIYAWQGNELILLRSATVGYLHTVEFDDTGMTERLDFSRYEVIIRDYTTNQESGQIIYRETYPNDDPQYEEHLALLDAALWEGL